MGPARRLKLVVLAGAVGVAVLAVVLAVRDEADKGIGGALSIASDGSRFESPVQAGDTFAVIAGLLVDDARACTAEHSEEHPRCVALSEAAAYVQTVAVTATSCTGPGVFELRERAVEYLRSIERVGVDPDAERPPVADIPSCR